MQRVLGLGGLFIKSADPQALIAWYRTHLGLDIQDWGGLSFGGGEAPQGREPVCVWSIFPAESIYFAPSTAPFMMNFRVADLHALLAVLRAEGCQVDDKVEESEFGRFGWVMDPDGNRIELWEPPAGPMPA